MAFGAIRAAERLGLDVPADLSVIGVDGHEYAEMFELTTVEQYPGEQGRLAVDVVLRLLDEARPTRCPTRARRCPPGWWCGRHDDRAALSGRCGALTRRSTFRPVAS